MKKTDAEHYVFLMKGLIDTHIHIMKRVKWDLNTLVFMPGRAIYNHCVFFVSAVKKISNKKDLTQEEDRTRKKAALVAALSSNHSWKTYKYIYNYGELDKQAISDEAFEAFREGWKCITENDVEEVVNANLNPHIFSMWLFYALGQDERNEYNDLYNKLKKEFAYSLEPMERAVD